MKYCIRNFVVLFILHTICFNATALDKVAIPVKALPHVLPVNKLVQVDDSIIADFLAEGLFSLAPGYQVKPRLAKDVSWDKTGQKMSIHLREAFFSNGDRVSADDVLSSIQRCVAGSEKSLDLGLTTIVGYKDFISGKTSRLQGLKKVSSDLIEISTEKVSPLLLDNLAFSNCYIVKANSDGSVDLLKGAFGAGPYTVTMQSPQKLVVTKRKNYHLLHGGPGSIEFVITDKYGVEDKLKDWAGMIITETPNAKLAGYTAYPYSRLGSHQLVFNNSKAPFNNPKIREAVAKGINFSVVSKAMGWRPGRLQAGLFPFGIPGFQNRKLVDESAQSLQILNSLGFTSKKPLRFKIVISDSALAQKERVMWDMVFPGLPIVVSVKVVKQEELIKIRNAGDFEALRVMKSPGSVEGYRVLASYLTTSIYNTPRANLPECDQLVYAALAEHDRESRLLLYRKADKCFMSSYILVPLSSVPEGTFLLKEPWRLIDDSQYNLMPYESSGWYKVNGKSH